MLAVFPRMENLPIHAKRSEDLRPAIPAGIWDNVRKSHSGVLSVLILALLSGVAASRDFGIESLRGLAQTRLAIVVEPLSPDVAKYLRESDVKNDMEQRLKHAGIGLVSLDEPVAPGRGFLYIDITSKNVDSHTLAAFITVSLYQPVNLPRDPALKPLAATWNDGVLVICSTDMTGKIRERVKDLTDSFVNAYLAANPK
jgi:hypothetical protein